MASFGEEINYDANRSRENSTSPGDSVKKDDSNSNLLISDPLSSSTPENHSREQHGFLNGHQGPLSTMEQNPAQQKPNVLSNHRADANTQPPMNVEESQNGQVQRGTSIKNDLKVAEAPSNIVQGQRTPSSSPDELEHRFSLSAQDPTLSELHEDSPLYDEKLDPNIKRLREKMEVELNQHEFDNAQKILRTAVDVSIDGIHLKMLREYDRYLNRYRALLGGTNPGSKCIEALSKAAKQFIDCVWNEAHKNTDKYKEISWKTRSDILDVAAENVKDEVCALESQLRAFVRDAVRDLKRLGHVGFGLQSSHSPDPRFTYYQRECNKTVKMYSLPDFCIHSTPESEPEPEPESEPAEIPNTQPLPQPQKLVLIQQPVAHAPPSPRYAVTTTTYHMNPYPRLTRRASMGFNRFS